jgi:hypothetical protein
VNYQHFSNESNYCVLWADISGMRWDELVPIVHSMTNCIGIPKMVLIHCGGNDIGTDPCGKLLFRLNEHPHHRIRLNMNHQNQDEL